jgi:hypothetical protein
VPIAEGGGPRPPYHESFLENIVNVSWQTTGGVFVSGDFCCYQRYTKIPRWDSPQVWTMLGHLGLGDGGSTFSSTYGKVGNTPVFLIGGNTQNSEHAVLRSTDGVEWEFVIKQDLPGATDNSVRGLFWDGKLFYVTQHGEGEERNRNKRCFYSPDGKKWYFAEKSFTEYCNYVLPGVPDGIYGYDSRTDMVIASYKFLRWYDEDDSDSSSAYVITNATTNSQEIFQIDVGLSYVGAVAYVGGIWMAGGYGRIYEDDILIKTTSMTTCSLDGGQSWFISTAGHGFNPFDDAIETIVGAPIRHFKSFGNFGVETYRLPPPGQ